MAAEIISYITQYYGTNIETDIPDDSSQWVTSGIFYEFEYVWTRNLTTYDDNTSLGTNPVLTNNFNKIVSVTIQYYGTDDEDDVPTSESQWVDTEPQTDYVWKRTRTEFIDGEVLYSDPERVNTGETDPEPEGPSTDEGDSSLILIDTSQEFYGTDDAEETPDAQTVWSTETPKDKIYIWIRVKTTYERETPDGNIPVIEYSEPTRDISEDERSHEGDDLDPATPIPADDYTPPESASDATAEDEIDLIIPTEPIPEQGEAEEITDWVAAQQLIFEKLTAFGQNEGIFYWEGEGENKQLFINASFIRTGTLQVGGTNNKFGVIQVLDANNVIIGQWDKTGFFLNDDNVLKIGNETAISLDYHSLQLIDKEGNTYFYVSDLREEEGWADLTDEFYGDGITSRFFLSSTAMDTDYIVKVGGNVVTPEHKTTTMFDLNFVPTERQIIRAYYKSVDQTAKAYTFGIRASGRSIGSMSVAEGYNVVAVGRAAHAEGIETKAIGRSSHAEGLGSSALGFYSHAEGSGTEACETGAHSEGILTKAYGYASHAQNYYTIAGYGYQTAIGLYNDNKETNLFEIGNGTDDNNRRNIFAIGRDGSPTIVNPQAWCNALGIGTRVYSHISNTLTVPSGSSSPTPLTNVNLTPGLWLVIASAGFNQGGTAGTYRAVRLGSTSTGDQYAIAQVPGNSAGNTVVQVSQILKITSNTTIYSSLIQASGVDLTVPAAQKYTYMVAIRIAVI